MIVIFEQQPLWDWLELSMRTFRRAGADRFYVMVDPQARDSQCHRLPPESSELTHVLYERGVSLQVALRSLLLQLGEQQAQIVSCPTFVLSPSLVPLYPLATSDLPPCKSRLISWLANHGKPAYNFNDGPWVFDLNMPVLTAASDEDFRLAAKNFGPRSTDLGYVDCRWYDAIGAKLATLEKCYG